MTFNQETNEEENIQEIDQESEETANDDLLDATPQQKNSDSENTENQNEEVNEYVLKLNGTLKLKGACFGIRNQHLILSYVRPVKGLDREELEWIVASIAVIADEYDDFLIEKFNL